MWLVVYDEEYYPAVYKCKTYEEAKQLFDEIKGKIFKDVYDPTAYGKLYIAEVKDSFGTNDE